MTVTTLLAEAAEAEREAHAIFSKIDAARGPSGPVTPAGFEADSERASDLMRRARCLRAEAAEVVQEFPPRAVAAPVAPPIKPTSTAGASAPLPPSAPAVEEPRETADTVAARIFNSDNPDSVAAEVLSSVPPAAADTEADAVARRILES